MVDSQTLFFSAPNLPDSQDSEISDACIANISPKERQLRKRAGIFQFVFALVILAVLVILHVNPLWRLLLFFMFGAATTTYIQALDKT